MKTSILKEKLKEVENELAKQKGAIKQVNVEIGKVQQSAQAQINDYNSSIAKSELKVLSLEAMKEVYTTLIEEDEKEEKELKDKDKDGKKTK